MYIDIHWKYIKIITKFRVRDHKLKIEMPRHTEPQTSAVNRKCKICNMRIIMKVTFTFWCGRHTVKLFNYYVIDIYIYIIVIIVTTLFLKKSLYAY